MYTLVGIETRTRFGNECVRQLVHVKHRHRAYAAVATRVPADYSVYLSMRRRGKQRRLSYSLRKQTALIKFNVDSVYNGALHYARR